MTRLSDEDGRSTLAVERFLNETEGTGFGRGEDRGLFLWRRSGESNSRRRRGDCFLVARRGVNLEKVDVKVELGTNREDAALWRRRLGPGVGIRRESARRGVGWRLLLLLLLLLRSLLAFPRPAGGKARKITQISRPLGIIHTGDKMEENKSVRLPEPTRDKNLFGGSCCLLEMFN